MGCAPYKDPFLITAQALSIVALLLSIAFWATILLGLAAMIMLQVCWCCKMNRCGIITAGVFACIAAAGDFVCGFLLLGEEICVYWSYDDDYYYGDGCDNTAAYIMTFIGGGLWVATGVGTFVFTCRIDQYKDSSDVRLDNAEGRNVTVAMPSSSAPVPIVVAAAGVKPVNGMTSTRTTVTYAPDGTKTTESVTVNPDGTQSIRTVIETV